MVISLVAAKFALARFVRFTVVAPAPPALSHTQLNESIKVMQLLCVGCTAGIGEAAAKAVCSRGGHVTVVGRRKPSALLEACKHTLVFIAADLSSMQTAQQIVRNIAAHSFDTVLFTVGIICTQDKQVSREGIEMDTAVSFLSRFVMSQELLAAGLASSSSRKPRIFVMGFPGTPDVPQLDDFNWDTVPFKCWPAHKNAVVANDALVLGLSRRHPEVNVFGLNPGIIKTDIMNDFLGGRGAMMVRFQQFVIGTIGPSATWYAEDTLLQLLAVRQLEGLSGAFFNQVGEQINPSGWLLTGSGNAERIWQEAERLAARALQPHNN